MAIEGPLRELGIHDVFQLLDLSRKTGVLRVTSELRDDEGVVFFDSGRVVRASIRTQTVPAEIALLQSGKITEDDLAAARAAKENGRAPRDVDLLDLLLEGGAITARELERQLRLQIESVVFELMSWREGFFSFEERSPSEMPSDARMKVSTESLLMEGARRIDEWSRIADKVPSLGVVPTLAPVAGQLPDGGSQLDLLPHEWEVLTMIDAQRDLRAIAAALGRSEFEVAKIAYGLVTTGVVELRAPARLTTSAPLDDCEPLLERAIAALRQGNPEEALIVARTALAGDAVNTQAHLVAARALGHLNRPQDAVEELRRAVHGDPLTPRVHLDLGFAAVRIGDFATARASWEHFLRLAPSVPDAARARAALETLTRLQHLLEAHSDG